MMTLAIVGASSDVAADLIDVLAERGFDLGGVRVLADESLAGEAFEAAGYDVRVEAAVPGSLGGCDVALFLGDGTLARELVPEAAAAGTLVIDATPFSHTEQQAPLLVAEIAAGGLAQRAAGGVVAVPGPHAVALAVALAPLHEAATVRRVVTTVFESAALHGREAMDELSRQSVGLMQGRGIDRDEFAEQLAFNVRPQAPAVEGGGWSVDELRLAGEVGALLGEPPVDVVATIVRVPVFAGAAQSVFVELERPLGVEEATRLLREGRSLVVADDVSLIDDDAAGPYGDDVEPDGGPYRDEAEPGDGEEPRELLHDPCPGPVDVSGSEAVHVARLRADARDARTLAFWIVFDELRKGTSLSLVAALQIALRELR